MFVLKNKIKDIGTGSNEFLKDSNDKPNLLVDDAKGIKSKYMLNEIFGFPDNKNDFTANLCKYSKKLIKTDAYKKVFL